jgi:ABC-2 type transport system permease protein
MKTLSFLLEKEFRQIFRNPAILRMMFFMPIIQLILLPLAANFEVKNVNVTVVDHDHSTWSRSFISRIEGSKYFHLIGYTESYKDAMLQIEHDKADIVLEIPRGFENNMVRENNGNMFLAVNAINGAKANIGAAYLQIMIKDYAAEIRNKLIVLPKISPLPRIETRSSIWFNIHMEYSQFMVPGILAILLTMVGAFLTALNIVKEKEVGTIEQINVTPIHKTHFILAKLIPFWVLGIVVLTIGFGVARLFYGISPEGSLLTVYVFASVYLIAVLGLGLLVSTYSQTQQQAMLIAFFLMMIFILMGGLYTSIDSMPIWAQWVTKFNPVKYFVEVMRMVILRGSGLADIREHLLIVFGFAVVLNSWAVINYKKRS